MKLPQCQTNLPPKTDETPPKMDPPVTEENHLETVENPPQHTDQPDGNAECSSSSDTAVAEHYDRSIEFEVNDFVAVSIETKKSKFCYFAKVIEIESEDILVEYLEKRGEYYQYPDVPEDSWQPKHEIVCKLPPPETVITTSRVKCIFRLNDEQKTCLKYFRLK